ncbi:MAG TPA: VOC family protein [Bacteroidia bacterium]|nr:VOC family protein [Bacteroidia bacterium]
MKSALLYFMAFLLFSCSNPPAEKAKTDSAPDSTPKKVVVIDTTPRITGFGGIFFFTDDVQGSKAWYAQNLGLDTNAYGATFEYRNANNPDVINYAEWSPFKKGSSYFSPSKKDFMINYRVQNIEGLVRKLRAGGATICDSIASYDYGKFVHILDNEGTKVELWEPIDHVLTDMGGKTVK